MPGNLALDCTFVCFLPLLARIALANTLWSCDELGCQRLFILFLFSNHHSLYLVWCGWCSIVGILLVQVSVHIIIFVMFSALYMRICRHCDVNEISNSELFCLKISKSVLILFFFFCKYPKLHIRSSYGNIASCITAARLVSHCRPATLVLCEEWVNNLVKARTFLSYSGFPPTGNFDRVQVR